MGDNITISLSELQAIHRKLDALESAMVANKTVLTFDEVVRYTGLSKSYMYKLTSAGLIPHFKPNGKQLFFKKDEVESWLLRNEVKSNESIDAQASNYATLKRSKI